MKKKSLTFGLTTQKISNLLKVCTESSDKAIDMETENQKTELLQDRLSETLLSGTPKDSPLSKELTYLCRISGIAAGESIRNLLVNPKTDLKLIKKIKEHGKLLSQKAQTESDHDTANTIYYAAIAYALVNHHEKITRFTYEDLEKSFGVFIDKEWISTDLSELFKKAIKCCQDHLNSNKG